MKLHLIALSILLVSVPLVSTAHASERISLHPDDNDTTQLTYQISGEVIDIHKEIVNTSPGSRCLLAIESEITSITLRLDAMEYVGRGQAPIGATRLLVAQKDNLTVKLSSTAASKFLDYYRNPLSLGVKGKLSTKGILKVRTKGHSNFIFTPSSYRGTHGNWPTGNRANANRSNRNPKR